MIDAIRLSDFLSFGENTEEIEMQRLNILIGANGSGKSNFLEAFDLLRCAPVDIAKPIREGGGASDWLYKGCANHKPAVVDVVVKNSLPNSKYSELRYTIAFHDANQQFEIVNEKIESKEPDPGELKPYIFYDFDSGKPVLNILNVTDDSSGYQYKTRRLQREEVDTTQSILVQKRDAIHYPEITFLAHEFAKIKMYREWSFGRYAPARLPQKIDLPNHYLEADCGNLGLVLNQIRSNYEAKKRLLEELRHFYDDVEDYEINIAGSTVQIFFQERGLRTPVPATRLSDGTLRYLCLLAILCHPTPPPLVCIEEPELGLHPEVLPNLANLLRETSERCQLVVTTHSEILVDCFTDHPTDVLVAEKADCGTQLRRLESGQIKPWLEKYRLGELWARGDIGGNRW